MIIKKTKISIYATVEADLKVFLSIYLINIDINFRQCLLVPKYLVQTGSRPDYYHSSIIRSELVQTTEEERKKIR